VKFVYWGLTALVALVLVIFAVSNRVEVGLTLFPMPAKMEAPLYLVVLVTLIVGFVLGEIAGWIGGARRRAEMRQLRRRLDRIQRDVAEARRKSIEAP
jgi:uncharacterized integral membrane protein